MRLFERTHKWYELGRSRHVFGNHQHEDGKRQQNGNSQRNLLAGVGRQPEPDQTEHRQPEAREDDVEQVVESTASNDDAERDVGVRFQTARVHDLIAFDADWQ